MKIAWSRLARALWIEIALIEAFAINPMSRLARALWIEIHYLILAFIFYIVEARESLVD